MTDVEFFKARCNILEERLANRLAAPREFFVEVDSLLSLIVHRHGKNIPEDVKGAASRIYHQARSIYSNNAPLTKVQKEQAEGMCEEFGFKRTKQKGGG